jgi:hypothetical protein
MKDIPKDILIIGSLFDLATRVSLYPTTFQSLSRLRRMPFLLSASNAAWCAIRELASGHKGFPFESTNARFENETSLPHLDPS